MCVRQPVSLLSFFFNGAATPEIYTLSLHDALPISNHSYDRARKSRRLPSRSWARGKTVDSAGAGDRKSTRLNSSHVAISYAVFCLKKKNITYHAATAAAFGLSTDDALRSITLWLSE